MLALLQAPQLCGTGTNAPSRTGGTFRCGLSTQPSVVYAVEYKSAWGSNWQLLRIVAGGLLLGPAAPRGLRILPRLAASLVLRTSWSVSPEPQVSATRVRRYDSPNRDCGRGSWSFRPTPVVPGPCLDEVVHGARRELS